MKFFLLFILISAGTLFAEPLMENSQWREDLKYLAEQLPAKHANAFHSVSREEFQRAVAELDRKIPALNRNQILTGMMRIVTMIGDGHTSLSPLFDSSIEFHHLPLQLHYLKDGFFVQKAAPEHKDLVGARVISIGNASAEQVYAAAGEITPHDNEMGVRAFAPFYMVMPEVLNGLGFIASVESVPFVFEINGKRIEKILRPAGMIQSMHHGTPDGWIDAAPAPLPLYLKRRNDNYWFEYLPQSKTVYVQYNQVRDQEEQSISDFAKQVFQFVDNNDVERFVLDVRFNLGGNNYLNKPILLGLIQAKKINQKGKLFVVIGRNTFSAAQNLVNEMEKYTNAIFVGEPTAENVNFYGDHEPVVLPNSKIHVMVSTLWWQNMDPRDHRQWTKPQIVAELTSDEYRKGIDPAFEAIRNCKYDSIVALMEEEMDSEDFSSLRTKIVAFQSDPAHGCVNIESELNSFGYQLLQKNRLELAIEIFKLNTEFYPASSNVFDSLGEAYLKAGKHALAQENYRKAVELNPKNETAKQILESLRHRSQ